MTSTLPTATPPDLPIDALCDPMTGIVKRVEPVLTPADAPSAYVSMTAAVADARALGDWPADRVSLGTTFADPAGARMAAIGEAVERYCGNFLPADLDPAEHRIGTREELLASGLPLVDLANLPRWASWQVERPGFEYEPLTETTPTLWTRCEVRTGPDAGRDAWWPAALVHLNWRQRRFRHLPRTWHLNYAGIATGSGFADACDRGLLEVIERDALTAWWHLDRPAHGIRPESVPGLLDALAPAPLELSLVALPSEFAPCVAALVRDTERGTHAAGFSCGLDAVRACEKATLEAVHTWIYARGLDDADGWVFRAVEAGVMAPGLHLPHRADRCYLDDAGPHMEHVRDLAAQLQVWQDPRTHGLARRFTHPSRGLLDVGELDTVSMTTVRRRLAEAGLSVHARDLTTSDVRRTALRVARVLVPGLVPNAPAAFTYLGCPRFAQIARREGLPLPSGPDGWTLTPPPHV